MRVIREWIESAGVETTAANTAQTTRVPKATPTTATTKIDAAENTAINIIPITIRGILAIALIYFVCIPFGASLLDENTGHGLFVDTMAVPLEQRLIIALVAFFGAVVCVFYPFRKGIIGTGIIGSAGIIEVEVRKVLKKPTGKLTKADLESVKRLYLSDNQLTDLRPLARLKLLEELILYDNPNLFEGQIDKLKKALPNCRIYHDFE